MPLASQDTRAPSCQFQGPLAQRHATLSRRIVSFDKPFSSGLSRSERSVLRCRAAEETVDQRIFGAGMLLDAAWQTKVEQRLSDTQLSS
jgi:hypothetical protein